MVHRVLLISGWVVDFLFAERVYDVDGTLACLRDAGAPKWALSEAMDLMENCHRDCGFTFSRRNRYSYLNEDRHRAVVLIGPTSSCGEFLDTFIHELRHLTDSIAKSVGIALDSEDAAYISGDTARELSDVVTYFICRGGCSQ